MAFGWEGKLVRLVPPDKERHTVNAYRWVNDLDVTSNLLIGGPITRGMEEAWFDKLANDDSNIHFAIETLDGRHLGMSGLHQINRRHGTAVCGSFLGEKDDRG